MARCLIALGSNLGDRAATLRRAVALLAAVPQVQVTAQSRWHETTAVGGPAPQPAYLNGALTAETSLAPEALLAVLQNIEHQLGRTRHRPWQSRPIDLDLLLYNQRVVDTPYLRLPHPRMAYRRFVLQPAAEVAGDWLHPTVGWTLEKLYLHLRQATAYVALAGPIGSGKSPLAAALLKQTAGRLVSEPLDAARLSAFYADPAGQAWQTEIEFVARRRQLLQRDGWPEPATLAVSDFWFDQSLAFASVWLDSQRYAALCDVWRAARRDIVLPKLLLVLDAPAEVLLARIVRRGRPYEQGLDVATLERLREALDRQTRQPDQGPVLRLDGADADDMLTEVLAAVTAMQ